MKRRAGLLALVLASGLAVSSCARIDVNSLPQPGNSNRDGYDIVMEFDNVLNLPGRAKVVLDGVTVGVVSDVSLASEHVEVTARINAGIKVPSNIQALLQQATVLGDIYVAFERPDTANLQEPALAPGARIPLDQTVSPPQLEDTIARLSTFVSSGSVQRVQNTIIGLNRLTPPRDEVRRLTSVVVDDLSDLAENIDQVDQLLDGAASAGQILHQRIPELQIWFSPEGQLGFERFVVFSNSIAPMLPAVGSVASGGFWLVPLLQSLRDSAAALQRSKINIEQEVPAYRRLLTDFFLPQDRSPAINITSIVGPDGRELSGDVEKVLRMLGAVP